MKDILLSHPTMCSLTPSLRIRLKIATQFSSSRFPLGLRNFWLQGYFPDTNSEEFPDSHFKLVLNASNNFL